MASLIRSPMLSQPKFNLLLFIIFKLFTIFMVNSKIILKQYVHILLSLGIKMKTTILGHTIYKSH